MNPDSLPLAGLFVEPAPGPVLANTGLENLRFLTPVKAGDSIRDPLPPIDFGRIAAQTAKRADGNIGWVDPQRVGGGSKANGSERQRAQTSPEGDRSAQAGQRGTLQLKTVPNVTSEPTSASRFLSSMLRTTASEFTPRTREMAPRVSGPR